jgi:hydroxymethylglutaryl-CoA reductase
MMTDDSNSPLPSLRTLPLPKRRDEVARLAGLAREEIERALATGGLDCDTADRMVENALGTLALPFGVAPGVRVNGVDYLVPMAIEEPSVVAAASHASKRVRSAGGFQATVDPSIMVAQIEVYDVADPALALARIEEAQTELVGRANEAVQGLVARGGGAKRVSTRDLGDGMIVTHVHVDCRDAMGANLVNTVAEALGARVAELADGTLGLRILSNYCDERITRVTASLPVDALGDSRTKGIDAARGIARASRFAERDPYRAVTHNKGIMNGVDAVVLATGNDWRAVEAGAHAHASRSGAYCPLATWRLSDDERSLEGQIEIPLALGIVGGALRAHPGARLALALLRVTSAAELAAVAAATGLATNLAALRALSTEGIQRGHMALHHRATAAKLPR